MSTLTPDVEIRCRRDVKYAVTPAAIARALNWPPARVRRAILRGELEAELVHGERYVVDLDTAAVFVANVRERAS